MENKKREKGKGNGKDTLTQSASQHRATAATVFRSTSSTFTDVVIHTHSTTPQNPGVKVSRIAETPQFKQFILGPTPRPHLYILVLLTELFHEFRHGKFSPTNGYNT